MRVLATLAIVAVAVASAPALGAAQSSDEALRSLEKEVQSLKEGQARLQRDLKEIRNLLQRPAAAAEPQALAFALSDLPIEGESTARLALVDFTDYQ